MGFFGGDPSKQTPRQAFSATDGAGVDVGAGVKAAYVGDSVGADTVDGVGLVII